jgi:Amt family ammonium transporter
MTSNNPSSSYIAALDGATDIDGGWIEKHYVQLGYQLAGSCAGFAWSFTLTCIILFLMNLIPGMALRVSSDDEDLGLDDVQLGEFAYDYVELTRHVSDVLPTNGHHSAQTSESAEKAV